MPAGAKDSSPVKRPDQLWGLVFVGC